VGNDGAFSANAEPVAVALGRSCTLSNRGLGVGCLGVAHFREAICGSAGRRHFPVSGGMQKCRRAGRKGMGDERSWD